MTDIRLRELERRFKQTGQCEDGLAWERELVRTGEDERVAARTVWGAVEGDVLCARLPNRLGYHALSQRSWRRAYVDPKEVNEYKQLLFRGGWTEEQIELDLRSRLLEGVDSPELRIRAGAAARCGGGVIGLEEAVGAVWLAREDPCVCSTCMKLVAEDDHPPEVLQRIQAEARFSAFLIPTPTAACVGGRHQGSPCRSCGKENET